MLKRTLFALTVLTVTPFLIPSFRAGFKEGWNGSMDEAYEETGQYPFPKSKNA